ncbi:hypothetical protein ACEQ8H_004925 [Pleosporales sp. CAS-2024a]
MPSSSSISVSSIVQYAILAAVVYVLAGAPFLSSSMGGDGVPSYSDREADASLDSSSKTYADLVIPAQNLSCGEHAYRGVYVVSREPLVVYIEGFLSEEERKSIIGMSEPHFAPATIWTNGQEFIDTTIRHSEKAPLPVDHDMIQCIADRARKFQGWRPYVFVERLWAQRYTTGGHYTYHYDWATATPQTGRISSFMVYLAGDCKGGGTHFPRLAKPADKASCQFIECDGPDGQKEGIVFKPLAGSAVYWENIKTEHGHGYRESWHAGLPVTEGVKMGLNIWSWWQVGYVPPPPSPSGSIN